MKKILSVTRNYDNTIAFTRSNSDARTYRPSTTRIYRATRSSRIRLANITSKMRAEQGEHGLVWSVR